MTISVGKVSLDTKPFGDSRLKRLVLIKINEPALEWKIILMTNQGPVAIGEIPNVSDASKFIVVHHDPNAMNKDQNECWTIIPPTCEQCQSPSGASES